MSNLPCHDSLKLIFEYCTATELATIAQVCQDFNICAIEVRKMRSKAKSAYDLSYDAVTTLLDNFTARKYEFNPHTAEVIKLDDDRDGYPTYKLVTPEHVKPYLAERDLLRSMISDYYLVTKYNLPYEGLSGYCSAESFELYNFASDTKIAQELVNAYLAHNDELKDYLPYFATDATSLEIFLAACDAGDVELAKNYIVTMTLSHYDECKIAFKRACAARRFDIVKLICGYDMYSSKSAFREASERYDIPIMTLLCEYDAHNCGYAMDEAVATGKIHIVKFLLTQYNYDDDDEIKEYMASACEKYVGENRIALKFQIIATFLAETSVTIYKMNVFKDINAYLNDMEKIIDWFCEPDNVSKDIFTTDVVIWQSQCGRIIVKDTVFDLMRDELLKSLYLLSREGTDVDRHIIRLLAVKSAGVQC